MNSVRPKYANEEEEGRQYKFTPLVSSTDYNNEEYY